MFRLRSLISTPATPTYGPDVILVQSWQDRLLDRLDTVRMWLRAGLCFYLTLSLPLRAAFYPDFTLSFKYAEYAGLDALATLFFGAEMFAMYRG